jgi:hypothetical protein
MYSGHRLGNLNGRPAKFRIVEKRMNAGFPDKVLCAKQRTASGKKTADKEDINQFHANSNLTFCVKGKYLFV